MNRTLRSVSAIALLAALGFGATIAPPAPAQTTGATAAQTTVAKAPPTAPNGGDPFAWLEEQRGARAMTWVDQQNARTAPILEADPHYQTLHDDAYKIITSKERIAYPEVLDGAVYNFWTDGQHQQGIWRRTSAASYATANPKWTTVLDLDALGKAEGKTWVFHGAQCNWPNESDCLIDLSNGGEDADTVREFNLNASAFVKGGFTLPRGKQDVAWLNRDTLLVAREWAPGQLTQSGYPYVIKTLKRGEPLSAAVEIFRGKPSDVSDSAYTIYDASGNRLTVIDRGVDFFNSEKYLYDRRGVHKLGLPSKVNISGMVDGRVIAQLDQDWDINGKHFEQGSVVAMKVADVKADPAHLKPALVYAPGAREAIGDVSTTRNDLILTIYQNVRGRAFVYAPKGAMGWSVRKLDLPDNSSIGVTDTNLHDNLAYLTVTSFLTPTTLWSAHAGTGALAQVKALPAMFDASNDTVDQHEATSADGTKIPYFVVHPEDMKLDG